jgi:hypothetical protein
MSVCLLAQEWVTARWLVDLGRVWLAQVARE